MAYRPKQLDKGRYRRSSSSDLLFKSSDIVVKIVMKFLTVFEGCEIVIRNAWKTKFFWLHFFKKSKFCKTTEWWNSFAREPQLAWILKLWVLAIIISQLLRITISSDCKGNLQLFLQMFCLLQIFRFFLFEIFSSAGVFMIIMLPS